MNEDFTFGLIHTDLQKNPVVNTKTHLSCTEQTLQSDTAGAAGPQLADREQHRDQQLNVAKARAKRGAKKHERTRRFHKHKPYTQHQQEI